MAKKNIQTIEKLANLLNKHEASNHFLQIMCVYKKVKNGYFPQTKNNSEIKQLFENEVAPLLRELGLYVSFKHGGLVTHDEALYKSWNSFGFHFRKKHFGAHYLGYPDCCDLRFNIAEQLLSFHLYYIIKRILVDKDKKVAAMLDMMIEDLMEIEEYQPCVVGCPKTHRRAQAFREVRKEFSSFLPSNYLAKRKERAKESLFDMLKPVNYRHSQRKMKRPLAFLKNKKMRELFQLDDDFFQEIEDLLENPKSKKKIIAKAEAYLKEI